jgi:hypothetical protein
MINSLVEKRGYTWGPDFPATLEAGRPLLLLLVLLLVPLGEIIPRWWWWWWRRRRWARWWWWRRTDAPLLALGLGVGLLGPTSSPLTLLGGLKRVTHQCDAAGVVSPPSTPRSYLGQGYRWRRCLQPLYPCPRGGGHGGGHGGGAGSHGGGDGCHTGRLGASSWRIEDPDPTVGVPAAGLTNRHAALVEGRQCGQDRYPQPWVVAERRDALEEDQGRRTHQ